MAYPTYPAMPTYGNYIPPQAPTQTGMFYMVVYKKTVTINREVMPLEIYDMIKRKDISPEPEQSAPDLSKYITRDELNDILSAYMTKKPPKKESITNG